MRVRVDSQGRPKPPASSNAQPSSSQSSTDAKPSSCVPKPPPERPRRANPLPLEPKIPAKPPFPPASSAEHAKRTASFARDASASMSRALSLPTASRSSSASLPSVPSTPSSKAPQVTDDASDSGSSAATEAYNSEDEHPLRAETTDVPMRTLREREDDFAAQLEAKSLRIVEMRPDGNCLFRALAHSVWNDQERHEAVRASVMQYLLQERDYFSQFVSEDFVRYIRRKSREGTHGNHLELQAAAELFARPIEVYSYAATPSTIIDSWGTSAEPGAAPEPIRLSFHRGNHYNAVLPANRSEKTAKRVAEASQQAQWRVPTETSAVQEEIERAVLALSLVEATRGDSAAGSASSSSAAVPSTVLALVNSGYSEESAFDAYGVAGHGGLPEMIRHLTNVQYGASAASVPPRRRKRITNLQAPTEAWSAIGASASESPSGTERKESPSPPRSRSQEQASSRNERPRDAHVTRRS